MQIDSPIHNLNEKSFLYQKIILSKKKLPILKHEKSLSFSKPKNFHYSLDKNYPLSKSQNNIISKKDINKGIVWLKDEFFKVPKLILPRKIKMIKSPLSERNISFTKSHNSAKLNNDTFNLTKGELPFFKKFEIKRDINEVLGLKKERSEIDIYFNKRREIDFDKYIEKLGVLKYLDERILKMIRVGKVENKSGFSYKNIKKEESKANSVKKSIIPGYMNKKLYEPKNNMRYSINKSYDNLKTKKKFSKKYKKIEELEKKRDSIRLKRILIFQKQIDKFDNIFREITWKLKNFYEKKRKEFEKFVEDEYPIKIDMKT